MLCHGILILTINTDSKITQCINLVPNVWYNYYKSFIVVVSERLQNIGLY